MLDRAGPLLLRERASFVVGGVAAVGVVAAATGVIYPLKAVAPVVSLGVVYLVAVLLVSAYWGVWLGLATSLASAAAFNWFHLPPVGRFTIADGGNWVALSTFVLVAVVTSTVAELARSRALEAERRRQEADLAAALARALLAGTETRTALAQTASRVAEALGVKGATIELGSVVGDRRREAVPLHAEGRQVATLLVPEDLPADAAARLREQVLPPLEALIAVALHRDALQAEAVETAALRRSDDIKTALLRAVSHDLRTPLTAILAAGHALSSPSLTEEEHSELSDAVVEEGERLARLVDKLLDLSRLQSGRAEPRREWTSLDEVLTAAHDSLARDAQLRFAIDADLPPVLADAGQLERAFANVLENAVRHSDGEPVSVRARLVGSRVMVRIVDRGPGIAPAEQERIFEPFYRGPGSDGAQSGSGLGLAIAKGFVEANGGKIWVESLPGQGTSFVVSFALEQPAAVRA